MSVGDLGRLRAFALVLDLGSVSAAAGVLGYTQSAVSQQLAALEREVGVPLVDRAQRPLRPTPAGAELRPHVDRVLEAAGALQAAVADLRGGRPHLRLAAFPSALSSFVPAAVRDLRRDEPDVMVSVVQAETREAIELLRAGAADLALVHYMPGVAVPDTTGLERRAVVTDHLFVVVPAGHRLARREQITVSDLRGEPLVLPARTSPGGRFRAVVEQLCARAGFEPHVAYELDDLPAVQAFVAAGIAVVPMHGLTLATLPAAAVSRPLAEQPAGSRLVEVLWAPGRSGAPAAALVDRLVVAGRPASGGGAGAPAVGS